MPQISFVHIDKNKSPFTSVIAYFEHGCLMKRNEIWGWSQNLPIGHICRWRWQFGRTNFEKLQFFKIYICMFSFLYLCTQKTIAGNSKIWRNWSPIIQQHFDGTNCLYFKESELPWLNYFFITKTSPPISESERLLLRQSRLILAQLRDSYSTMLNSYKGRIVLCRFTFNWCCVAQNLWR